MRTKPDDEAAGYTCKTFTMRREEIYGLCLDSFASRFEYWLIIPIIANLLATE